MESGCEVDPVSLKTKINSLLFFIRTCSGSHYEICIRVPSPLFVLYNLTKPLVIILASKLKHLCCKDSVFTTDNMITKQKERNK
jgi:hypothetical protein